LILRVISHYNIQMIELYQISIGILRETQMEIESLIQTIIAKVLIKEQVPRI